MDSRRGTPSFPPLHGDLIADVVVVGAGISGLTTAVLFQRTGPDVVVIDMHRVASGTTGHTTGKVTSQHGLCYVRLAAEHGEETARMYGEANEAGVAMVAELAAEVSAACDLTRAPAYVYTTDDERVGDIEREASIAARVGLPAVLAYPAEAPSTMPWRRCASTTSCTSTPIATARRWRPRSFGWRGEA